jgi:2-polyprenyl-6-hydroxyphenyl methylase/3-demethylubiquinone-9 3-methyltransferase
MDVISQVTRPVNAFAFGENWQAFLRSVDESRIAAAISGLTNMLGQADLTGQRFLDVGCGSGLSSLSAYRLGATVVSIDYDPQCVACAQELRTRFAASDATRWHIEQGSVLDESAMSRQEPANIVYSWGVLHHTGDMARAIRIASERVVPGGLFMIAIYNDQGSASRRWLRVKQSYQRLPRPLSTILVASIAGYFELRYALIRLSRFKNPLPFAEWREKKLDRGMSVWHDWVDWVGGYPFEVAKVEEIVVPLRKQGFILENLATVGSGWGCNEYVFRKSS